MSNPASNQEVAKEKRTASIIYEYDRPMGHGVLEIGTPILRHISQSTDESYSYAIKLKHNNFLGVKFVHLFGNTQSRGKNKTVPREPGSSGRDIMIHQLPLETYRTHVDNMNIKRVSQYKDIEGTSNATCYYVPEAFRVFVSGPIDLILKLHKDGRSLEDKELTLDNLSWGDGVVMIHGVGFRTPDATQLDGFFQTDWFWIRRLIEKEMFEGYIDQLEEVKDMKHLLDLMKTYNGKYDDALLKNHLATLSYHSRLNFFKNCWDMGKLLETQTKKKGKFDAAVKWMGPNAGWQKKRITNNPNTFAPVMKCYKSYIEKGGHYKNSNMDILRCARDLATHMSEHFVHQSWFTEMDIDLMIMSSLGEELIKFHQGLCLGNILKKII